MDVENPNPDATELCSLVRVGEDAKRGRFVEAVADIPVGTVVCHERGVVFGINPSKCTYCLRDTLPRRVRCGECASTQQCYADVDSPLWTELNSLGLVGLTARVLLSYQPTLFDDYFIHRRDMDNAHFNKIFHLQRCPEPDDFGPVDDFLTRMEEIVLKRSDWQNTSPGLFRITFAELFSRLKVNAHVIHTLGSTSEVPDGTGLFPISSIFNHSCRANVFSFFNRDRFVWVSMGIRKGEEVVDDYGVQAHSVSYETRKEFLAGRGFACICAECRKGPRDDLLVVPEHIQIPSRLSFSEIQKFCRRTGLSHDHLAIYHLLEDNVMGGTADAEECFEMLQANQRSRGVKFSEAMLTHYTAMIEHFGHSRDHASKVDDWLLSAIFLGNLYCKGVHPSCKQNVEYLQRRAKK